MRKERTTFTPEFKMLVVLESFKTTLSIEELAHKHAISTKNILKWKKHFLQHAHLAFETTPSSALIEQLKEENRTLETLATKLLHEKDEAIKKLKSLDISTKKSVIEVSSMSLSIAQQCKLIGLNRPSLYYAHRPTRTKDDMIITRINELLQTNDSHGYRKIHQKLLEEGFRIGVNKVHKLMKQCELPKKSCSHTDLAPPNPLPYTPLLHDLELIKPFKV